MKKVLLTLTVVAVGVVGVICFLMFAEKIDVINIAHQSGSTSLVTPNVTSFKKACDIFTQSDGEIILGVGASKAENSGSSDVVTAERSVTTCIYKIDNGTNLKQATVLLRASSANEAKAGFFTAKQADAVDVNSLGEIAYWSPTYGQLNVLKGGTWMILSVDEFKVGEHSQIDTEKLAKILVSRL